MYIKAPALAAAGCVALIVLGLAVSRASWQAGIVLLGLGFVFFAVLLMVSAVIAWRGDQKRAWNPGSARREHRDELEAKQK